MMTTADDAQTLLPQAQTTDQAVVSPDSGCGVTVVTRSRTPKDGPVVRLTAAYLTSLNGLLKLAQTIASLIALICLVSSDIYGNFFSELPLAWHMCVFVFLFLFSCVTSLAWILANVTSVIHRVVGWDIQLIEITIYGVYTCLYLIGSSLVANNVDMYKKMEPPMPVKMTSPMVVSVVLGYFCMFLYGGTCVRTYNQWKGWRHADSNHVGNAAQRDPTVDGTVSDDIFI
ncbi:uncharacterized protein LOC106173089 [Lingula anatina]|uniref:Uncharacterized protein LOC106173089 n=1 Tax=Lingula anatina TaxID=7574 RepID=A0A1S3JHC0_LINAN|nr:uncharacterized protein LOC106173089 [Lingula anatina]|eukprot:XP_013409536.1 uncharacterized protein LOC106173089 [Lingula anatina]